MRSRIRGNGFRILSFTLIGMMNALIDIGVLNMLLQLHPTTNAATLFIYNTAAYVMAVTNSYIWNSRITFYGRADFGWREKFRFALQAGVALLVSNGVFLLGVRGLAELAHFGIQAWVRVNAAKVLAMLLSSACSFVLMNHAIFTVSKSGRHK